MRFGNTNKGVAGLTILLSLVTMLFVIGLLVMIFALMGGELQEASFNNTAFTVTNESVAVGINGTLNYTVGYAERLNFGDFVVTDVWNATDGSHTIADWFVVYPVGNIIGVNSSVDIIVANVTYSASFDTVTTATEVMNDTTVGISSVTDWFAIFIVIGAMVVLILLTVIIITAIRGSGLMAGGSA